MQGEAPILHSNFLSSGLINQPRLIRHEPRILYGAGGKVVTLDGQRTICRDSGSVRGGRGCGFCRSSKQGRFSRGMSRTGL
ncbi:hypothetical protein Amal_03470 [Acetobacter malorum]|uniref:Uncharacterized protein n=1 Tax=Acetobacter malorum TaxID=178901 RepID=A0A177G6D4_9PROT|nr:hypothetical protein Amal_03470 [Acetobacter malorum]